MKESKIEFDIIFDNGEGVQIQTKDQAVHFFGHPEGAAYFAFELFKGNTSEFNLMDSTAHVAYEHEDERIGFYDWMNQADIEEFLADKDQEGFIKSLPDRKKRGFFLEIQRLSQEST